MCDVAKFRLSKPVRTELLSQDNNWFLRLFFPNKESIWHDQSE